MDNKNSKLFQRVHCKWSHSQTGRRRWRHRPRRAAPVGGETNRLHFGVHLIPTFIKSIQKGSFILMMFAGVLLIQEAKAQRPDLFAAVKSNNIKEVKSLLDKGADLNAYDDDSDNVLINAALYASADCMRLLLQKKANPNLKNKFGQTPLMYCTYEMDKMKLLLQYGADINAKSNSGNTPLLIACIGYGQYENIKFLIDKGADPLATNNKITSLMRAVQSGDTMTVHLLIGKGVVVNENPWGYTALMFAARYANWPCVFSLLDNGADPNKADTVSGQSPLLWAAEFNNIEAVKVLLKQTKNINTIDSIKGMTPLMWAVYNEHDNPQIIQALLDKGALVNIKAKDGSTALSWALKKGNTATVALLRKAGAE